MKIIMCVTNKAINAFQQGKQAKQEILHSVIKVRHVIPYQLSQGLSELKGHEVLYRQSLQIQGLRAPNVLYSVCSYYSPWVKSLLIVLLKSLISWLRCVHHHKWGNPVKASWYQALLSGGESLSFCKGAWYHRPCVGGLLHSGFSTKCIYVQSKSTHPTILILLLGPILAITDNLEVLKTSTLSLVSYLENDRECPHHFDNEHFCHKMSLEIHF